MISCGRSLRGRAAALVGVTGMILMLAFGVVARAAEPPLAPSGFKVRASNGYVLSVLGVRRPAGRSSILLAMRSKGAQVLYSTEASVGPTSIEADLGALGRIDVEFGFSGESRRSAGFVAGNLPS